MKNRETMFMLWQNNSGGYFEAPAEQVYVFADDKDEAERLLRKHIRLCNDNGTYASFDECGCCPCCGHRWVFEDDDRRNVYEAIGDLLDPNERFYTLRKAAFILPDGSLHKNLSRSFVETITSQYKEREI